MLTANYFTIDGRKVGDEIQFNTNDIEFASLQVEALTDLKLIRMANNFAELGNNVKRMVIGRE